MMIKAVAVLVMLLGVMSFGLYKSIQANGALEQQQAQMEQALTEANDEIIAMVETEKNNQRIASENIKRRNAIINQQKRQIANLSTIERGNPDVKEFLDQSIPDAVVNWLRKNDGSEERDSEAVPASAVHGADTESRITVPNG